MLVGLELIGRAIPRTGHEVLLDGVHCGTVTSGTFSPTLKKSIALARIDPLQLKSGLADSGLPDIDDGQSILARECQVLIRGKPVAAKIVKPPFVSKTN